MSRIHCYAVSHSSSSIVIGTVSPQYLLTFQLTVSRTFHTTAPTATVMSPPVSHVTSCHSAVSVYLEHSQSDILRPAVCQIWTVSLCAWPLWKDSALRHSRLLHINGPLYPDKSTNWSMPCDAAYLSHLLHHGQGMKLHLFWASNFRFWTNFLFKAYFIYSFHTINSTCFRSGLSPLLHVGTSVPSRQFVYHIYGLLQYN